MCCLGGRYVSHAGGMRGESQGRELFLSDVATWKVDPQMHGPKGIGLDIGGGAKYLGGRRVAITISMFDLLHRKSRATAKTIATTARVP